MNLEDAIVQNQFFLTQLGEKQGREILPLLAQVRKYTTAKLVNEGQTIASRKRLNTIIRDIRGKTREILSEFTDDLVPYAEELAVQQSEFYSSAVSDSLDGDFETNIPADAKIIAASNRAPMAIGPQGTAVNMSWLMRTYAPQEAKRVASRIVSGWSIGETTAEMARSISGTRANNYKDGLLNISRGNAFSLAKTYTTQLGNKAKEVFNKENSDLIIGYEILATLDSKTSAICRRYDGERFIYDEGGIQPHVPLHFNCRSTEVPYINPKYATANSDKRPSIGATGIKEVSGKKTYYTWLKDQPAWFQDKALGKEKGLIFRNAGLTTSEFKKAATTNLGRPISIEEMGRNNKEIAKYLNK